MLDVAGYRISILAVPEARKSPHTALPPRLFIIQCSGTKKGKRLALMGCSLRWMAWLWRRMRRPIWTTHTSAITSSMTHQDPRWDLFAKWASIKAAHRMGWVERRPAERIGWIDHPFFFVVADFVAFLCASSHIYERSCPSVGLSVRWSRKF